MVLLEKWQIVKYVVLIVNISIMMLEAF